MIDFHAHFVPESALVSRSHAGRAPSYDPATRIVSFPSGPSRPVAAGLMDLDGRIRSLGENAIGIQVLSPWTELIGDDLDAANGLEWARHLNDRAAEAVGQHPMFRLMAALPARGEDAAVELARCVGDLGFVGGTLPTQLAGIDLDDCHLDDLFSVAERLTVPLFIHPGRVLEPDRMSQFFLSNICGYPFETTLAALRLFFSGTLDRHPGLNLVLAHGGGTLPMLAGRAAHTIGRVPGVPGSPCAPAEILSRFFYDTVIHDPAALAFAMRQVGFDRMVLGTDMPFPMAIEKPATFVQEAAAVGTGEGEPVDAIARLDVTARRLIGI